MFVNYLRETDRPAFDRMMKAILDDRSFKDAVNIGYHEDARSLWEKFIKPSAQAPSDPQGYCVNRSADFYPYTGETCKSGYQLRSGNCRRTDGRIVAVPREECLAQAGTVELPFENGIQPRLAPRR